jgi:hypothetical protein
MLLCWLTNKSLKGPEYGHIWTDDRSNDNGIYLSCELGDKDKIAVLRWCELWLDHSINKINATRPDSDTGAEQDLSPAPTKKPW